MQSDHFGTGALSGAIGSFMGSSGSKYLANASGFVKAVGTTLIGGLSGGIGSRLAGGKFWDGFRNGAISAGLNHAAHSLQQVNPARLKRKILADGRLTFREARKWWKYGGGESLTVDGSKIDLDFIKPSDWTLKQQKSVQTLLKSRDGLVYGNLDLTYEGNNKFSFTQGGDRFDFNMHSGPNASIFRNFATRIGSVVVGQGTPYWINIQGLNTVNYTFPIRYNK